MPLQTADIIIIGGGITGCCLAYELRKKKISVIVIEKNTIGAASSGRSGGGIRQQNRVPQELPLAMMSVKVWQEMAQTFDQDFEYRQNGNLKLVMSENDVVHFQSEVSRQQNAGLDVHFLNESQVRELLPALSLDIKIFGGTYCPGDGSANPLLITKIVADQARKAGAAFHEYQAVNSIKRKKRTSQDPTMVVRTGKRSYESAMVINAAGAWAGQISTMAELPMPPCRIMRSNVMVTKAIPPIIAPFVSHPKGYMRQAVNGNLHMGVSSAPGEGFDVRTDINIFDSAGYYLSLFPFMKHLPIIRTWAGLTYWTPDAFPIISQAPGLKDFFLIAGFSGHGFCLGPGAAKVLSQLINGEEPEVDLACFSWRRFTKESWRQ